MIPQLLSEFAPPTPEWDFTTWFAGFFYSGRQPSTARYVAGVNKRPHRGLDQDAPQHSPIISPADGVPRAAHFSAGAGYKMVLDHGPVIIDIPNLRAERELVVGETLPLWTRHLHMPAGAFAVAVGEPVTKGQRIGAVGCTGSCAGYHNHTEIRIGHEWGHAIDPLPVYDKGAQPMDDFAAFIAGLQKTLNFHGFEAGPVDGEYGPLTQQGIDSLVAAAAEEPGGGVAEALADALRHAADAAGGQ